MRRVPPTRARTLRSTSAIESMISICREHPKNVKQWQDGRIAMRWCAAGMIEAARQCRPRQRPSARPGPRTARRRAECQPHASRRDRERSLMIIGPPPKFHGTRDILQQGGLTGYALGTAGRQELDTEPLGLPPSPLALRPRFSKYSSISILSPSANGIGA